MLIFNLVGFRLNNVCHSLLKKILSLYQWSLEIIVVNSSIILQAEKWLVTSQNAPPYKAYDTSITVFPCDAGRLTTNPWMYLPKPELVLDWLQKSKRGFRSFLCWNTWHFEITYVISLFMHPKVALALRRLYVLVIPACPPVGVL